MWIFKNLSITLRKSFIEPVSEVKLSKTRELVVYDFCTKEKAVVSYYILDSVY